jgi:hypothetical protein
MSLRDMVVLEGLDVEGWTFRVGRFRYPLVAAAGERFTPSCLGQFPLIPAQAGIQLGQFGFGRLSLGPRFRGDEREARGPRARLAEARPRDETGATGRPGIPRKILFASIEPARGRQQLTA